MNESLIQRKNTKKIHHIGIKTETSVHRVHKQHTEKKITKE